MRHHSVTVFLLRHFMLSVHLAVGWSQLPVFSLYEDWDTRIVPAKKTVHFGKEYKIKNQNTVND